MIPVLCPVPQTVLNSDSTCAHKYVTITAVVNLTPFILPLASASGPSGPSGSEPVSHSMTSEEESESEDGSGGKFKLDKKNWHISLFGEIIKDNEEDAEAILKSLSEETLNILEKYNATKVRKIETFWIKELRNYETKGSW